MSWMLLGWAFVAGAMVGLAAGFTICVVAFAPHAEEEGEAGV